jgi:hypothetical protein
VCANLASKTTIRPTKPVVDMADSAPLSVLRFLHNLVPASGTRHHLLLSVVQARQLWSHITDNRRFVCSAHQAFHPACQPVTYCSLSVQRAAQVADQSLGLLHLWRESHNSGLFLLRRYSGNGRLSGCNFGAGCSCAVGTAGSGDCSWRHGGDGQQSMSHNTNAFDQAFRRLVEAKAMLGCAVIRLFVWEKVYPQSEL